MIIVVVVMIADAKKEEKNINVISFITNNIIIINFIIFAFK